MFSSWTATLLTGFILSQMIIMLVTVYFHRACSHSALTLKNSVHRVARFLSWFLIAMVPREFAAVHRKHHAKCDTLDDPHSPKNHGWHGVLFGGLGLYRKEIENKDTLEKYGKGLPLDPWENFYQKHRNLGIFSFALCLTLLLGAKGLLLWFVLMLWIPFWAAGVINGLGHHIGYRNYETGDLSTNLSPWGLWIGGEELHNNHHAYPSSAKFSKKAWEVDIGWGVILCLKKLGLASVREKDERAEESVSSFLSDKYSWLQKFHESIDRDFQNDLLAAGYKRWSDVSVVLFGEHTKEKMVKKKEDLLKIISGHDMFKSIVDLEKDLRSFWDKRNSMTHQAVLSWKARAQNIHWPSVALFASSVPEPKPALAAL